MRFLYWMIPVLLCLCINPAWGSPKSLSLSGVLQDVNGTPVTSNINEGLSMTVWIGTRIGTAICFPYRKTFTNISVQNGLFSIDLPNTPDLATESSPNLSTTTLSEIFNMSSGQTISGAHSATPSTSCSISAQDRANADYLAYIQIEGTAPMGPIPLRAAAFAHFAHDSKSTYSLREIPLSTTAPTNSTPLLKFSSGTWTPSTLNAADIPDLSALYLPN